MSLPLEKALTFTCEGDELVGILHVPGERHARFAVLIVVGGPQYRVGSHRQFVLLARELAKAGYPVLRFDHRGMGDSSGESRTFEAIDGDIRTAVDVLCRECPAVGGVVCYGLCDAASALLGYSMSDRRIAGLILANPWARTQRGQAQTFVRHYYLRRFTQISFWRKLLAGEVRVGASIRSAAEFLCATTQGRPIAEGEATPRFLQCMLNGLQRASMPVLIQISELDLTAKEFMDLAESTRAWRNAMHRPNVTITTFDRADHTFSSSDALRRSTRSALDWLGRAEHATGV